VKINWSTFPRADGKTLIVAELPGVNSVQLATMLAMDSRFAVDRWRPVPLFNATHDTKAEVPQVPIIRAMMAATDELAFASIPLNAPRYSCWMLVERAGAARPRRERLIIVPSSFPRTFHREIFCCRWELRTRWCW
jgi:hypothetical protein